MIGWFPLPIKSFSSQMLLSPLIKKSSESISLQSNNDTIVLSPENVEQLFKVNETNIINEKQDDFIAAINSAWLEQQKINIVILLFWF